MLNRPNQADMKLNLKLNVTGDLAEYIEEDISETEKLSAEDIEIMVILILCIKSMLPQAKILVELVVFLKVCSRDIVYRGVWSLKINWDSKSS